MSSRTKSKSKHGRPSAWLSRPTAGSRYAQYRPSWSPVSSLPQRLRAPSPSPICCSSSSTPSSSTPSSRRPTNRPTSARSRRWHACSPACQRTNVRAFCPGSSLVFWSGSSLSHFSHFSFFFFFSYFFGFCTPSLSFFYYLQACSSQRPRARRARARSSPLRYYRRSSSRPSTSSTSCSSRSSRASPILARSRPSFPATRASSPPRSSL